MKKADLIANIADMAGITKVMADQIVNEGIFGAIVAELTKKGTVDIAGFGKFTANPRAARTARNPRTGEAVNVPATTVPKFKAAKAFKDAVAGK